MAKLRIGVAGLHHWYSAIPFVKSAINSNSVSLIAIAHEDKEQLDDVLGSLDDGSITTFTDPLEMVMREDIDVVASFLPTNRNAAVCVAALESGKHVISTKPVAFTVDEASRVRDAVQQSGRFFWGYETYQRQLPWVKQVKAWVDSGKMGAVRTITWQSHSGLPRRWHDSSCLGWWVDANQAPGGAWIDHAIYHLDVSCYLLDSDPTDVSGVAGNLRYKDLSLEDYGTASFTFESDCVVNIEDTWIATLPFGTRFSLLADEGWIKYNVGEPTITYRTRAMKQPEVVKISTEGPNIVEIVAQEIAQGVSGLKNASDSLLNLDWCQRFNQKAERM